MSTESILTEVNELSISERILLVEDLWDSIASNPEQLDVTDAQKKELDRRIANAESNPESSSSWSEVRSRIESE